MKKAQTSANRKITTSQAKLEIRNMIIPAIIFDKEDGIIKENINAKAEFTNKETKEAEEKRGNNGDSVRGCIQLKEILK